MESFEIQRSRRKEAQVDVAPLLDMVFILLIFFVVTSTFTRDTGVEVTKPQASSAQSLQKENILIAITREGTIHINERQVDIAGAKDVLVQMIARNPDREAVIVADRGAQTGMLVQVMDACNLSGVKKVSIAALNP